MNSQHVAWQIKHLPQGGVNLTPPSQGNPDNRLTWLAAMGIPLTGSD